LSIICTADDERTKKMAKVDGGYMFISSFYTALLSFGVDPIASMGYTAIFCIPLFLSVFDLIDDEDQLLFGLSTQAWAFILVAFMVHRRMVYWNRALCF